MKKKVCVSSLNSPVKSEGAVIQPLLVKGGVKRKRNKATKRIILELLIIFKHSSINNKKGKLYYWITVGNFFSTWPAYWGPLKYLIQGSMVEELVWILYATGLKFSKAFKGMRMKFNKSLQTLWNLITVQDIPLKGQDLSKNMQETAHRRTRRMIR